jgi:hypothetical protein
MKSFIILVLITLSLTASAKIGATPLKELVENSDHIVVAKIVKVDEINNAQKEIEEGKANNGIRLHFEISSNDYIKTNGKKEKRLVVIRMSKMRHLSLKSAKELNIVGTKRILLLKGKDYQETTAYFYNRSLDEKKKILNLIK